MLSLSILNIYIKKNIVYIIQIFHLCYFISMLLSMCWLLWSVKTLATVKARTLRIFTGCVKLPRTCNNYTWQVHLLWVTFLLPTITKLCMWKTQWSPPKRFTLQRLTLRAFNIDSITEKPFQIYAIARRSIMRWYFSNLPKYTSNLLFVLVCPF